MRRLLVLVLAIALVGPACDRVAEGPLRYSVDVDAKSTPAEKFQFSAFFPSELQVMGGDTIRFRNRATEAPHTISFGIQADRSNQPPILTDSGENAVVVEPCDVDKAPTNGLVKCTNKKLGAFDGQGYWNSGFLSPASAPEGTKAVALKLADDIPTGNYSFVCILHPFMSGAIQVVDEAADRSALSDVRKGALDSAAATRDEAEGLEEPEVKKDGDTVTMAAGFGDRVTSVNRFAPTALTITEGQTVKWEASNPYEPHNVTFGKPPKDASPFAPGGLESGADMTGTEYGNSGLFGAEGTPFAGSYSLRFPEAGSYEYTCLLHPGMDATINVGEA